MNSGRSSRVVLGLHCMLDTWKREKLVQQALARDSDAFDVNTAQLYTHGPRSGHRTNCDTGAVLKWVQGGTDRRRHLFVHSPYVLAVVWRLLDGDHQSPAGTKHHDQDGNDSGKGKKPPRKYAMDLLRDVMRQSHACGASGVVLHISNRPNKDIEAVMELMAPIILEEGGWNSTDRHSGLPRTQLLLEIVAAHPTKDSYETPQKLNRLTALLERNKTIQRVGVSKLWWGWCFDTAHLWSSGVDIRYRQDAQNWIDALSPSVRRRWTLLHLNGSQVELGGGRDVHAIPFGRKDLMWGERIRSAAHRAADSEDGPVSAVALQRGRQSGLGAFARHCRREDIPMVCEINQDVRGRTQHTLKLIRLLSR